MNPQIIIAAAQNEHRLRAIMEATTFGTEAYQTAWKAWKRAEEAESVVRRQEQATLPKFCVIDPC